MRCREPTGALQYHQKAYRRSTAGTPMGSGVCARCWRRLTDTKGDRRTRTRVHPRTGRRRQRFASQRWVADSSSINPARSPARHRVVARRTQREHPTEVLRAPNWCVHLRLMWALVVECAYVQYGQDQSAHESQPPPAHQVCGSRSHSHFELLEATDVPSPEYTQPAQRILGGGGARQIVARAAYPEPHRAGKGQGDRQECPTTGSACALTAAHANALSGGTPLCLRAHQSRESTPRRQRRGHPALGPPKGSDASSVGER